MFQTVRVSEFGVYLGKHSERLVVRRKGVETEIPFFQISEILLPARGAALSSEVIHEACRRGIRIAFQLEGGRPYAMLSSPMLTATVQTRRAQYAAFDDDRGFRFARAVVAAKIRNQEALLRYAGKYLKETAPIRFALIEKAAALLVQARGEATKAVSETIDRGRGTLMGIEGSAGRVYWSAVKELLGDEFEFAGRHHRGARDAVNSLLNYGYGILYSRVWAACLNAGLDPFAGYLHVDRSGKPSLVLDLVEQFRQPIVDRAVLSILRSGQQVRMQQGKLSEETRSLIAEKVVSRLGTATPFRGKRLELGSIVQAQARRLAVCLREDRDYRPYTMNW